MSTRRVGYSPLWLWVLAPLAIIIGLATVWVVNNAEHVGHLR